MLLPWITNAPCSNFAARIWSNCSPYMITIHVVLRQNGFKSFYITWFDFRDIDVESLGLEYCIMKLRLPVIFFLNENLFLHCTFYTNVNFIF